MKPAEPPPVEPASPPSKAVKAPPTAPAKATNRKHPAFLVDAVQLLAGSTPEGKLLLSPLGQYLKRTDPAFSSKTYGHSGLLNMVKSNPALQVVEESAGRWGVRIKAKK